MIHVLTQNQFLPIDLKAAWEFFSTPKNLNEITPPDLSFKICSDLPQTVYPGLMIVYKIAMMKVIRFEWVTEITHIQEPKFFVDNQVFGPYSMWHHEHHFEEVPGGVMMKDIVHYKLPLGWFGNLFHGLLVKPQLKAIFQYRKDVLEKRFGR